MRRSRGGAELSFSSSKPLAGYTILALGGTRNGEPFACPGASCSVPLVERVNDFTFWALWPLHWALHMASTGWAAPRQEVSCSRACHNRPGTASQGIRGYEAHTQPPDLNLAAGGSFCLGCGETLDITLEVQDAGSGVAEWAAEHGLGRLAEADEADAVALEKDLQAMRKPLVEKREEELALTRAAGWLARLLGRWVVSLVGDRLSKDTWG